ncbi:MAG: phosphoglycolate phosphatase [Granulosicoccus sp.]|nr:phosphoglycolate phosphatase [Granulosicoccus sp.]
MLIPARAALFDLDGTLIDSVPDIAEAANLTMDALNLPRRQDADLRRWVGNGSPTLMKRALTGEVNGEPNPALLTQALEMFFDLYAENIWNRSRMYDHVQSTLQSLIQKGCAMACVTNKPMRHTKLLLDACDLSQFFCVTVGGDTLPKRKPDPAQLLFAAEQLQVAVNDCVMVGDSINDIAAAQAAPMPVICLSYGYNQGMDLSQSHPDALIDGFEQILDHVTIKTA